MSKLNLDIIADMWTFGTVEECNDRFPGTEGVSFLYQQ